jgi:hypothetical protein
MPVSHNSRQGRAAPIEIKAPATGAAKRRSGRHIQPKPHGDAAASVQ